MKSTFGILAIAFLALMMIVPAHAWFDDNSTTATANSSVHNNVRSNNHNNNHNNNRNSICSNIENSNSTDVDVNTTDININNQDQTQGQLQGQLQDQSQGQSQAVINAGNTTQTAGDIDQTLIFEDKREFLAGPGLMAAPEPLAPDIGSLTAITGLYESILAQGQFTKADIENMLTNCSMVRATKSELKHVPVDWFFKKSPSDGIAVTNYLDAIPDAATLAGSASIKTDDRRFMLDVMIALLASMKKGADYAVINIGMVPKSKSFGLSLGSAGSASGLDKNPKNPYAYAGSAGATLGYNEAGMKLVYIVTLTLYDVK